MQGVLRSRLKFIRPGVLSWICLFFLCVSTAFSAPIEKPKRLKLGTSIPLKNITPEKMRYAKSLGIDYIEVGWTSMKIDLVGRDYVIQNKAEVMELLRQARKAADEAGITIWSVHMLAGAQFEISKADEEERRRVVALQKQLVVDLLPSLHPKVVLFHPSFFLPKEEKEIRLQQLIKSAAELDGAVKSIGATMVLENMNDASDKHMVLMQTTDDMVETLNLLPDDIYAAIDLNHISHPEETIKRLGSRVKTLHVSDGTGIQEKHWSPCSGKGVNNWVAILSALDEIGYSGPFLFEVAATEYSDLKELTSCYDKMYEDYVKTLPQR